jgi:2'-5' RNA ligase
MTKSEELIRSFICLNIPDEWATALAEVAAPLKKVRSRISWAKSYHLTLKFLGEIPPAMIEKIRGVVQGTVAEFSPFALSLGSVGCFPGPRSPRVLWVDVTTDEDTLSNLQLRLDKKLEKIGFPREKRRFSPHLTLGRIRRLEASDRLGERLRSLSCPEVSSFRVTSVDLIQSQLGRQGAEYSLLDSFTLGGKPTPEPY